MTSTLVFFSALTLFCAGVWLSAFFSGSETGFYRVSFMRLTIDAHAGDSKAQRLLWFTRNPSYFVATTLVGNNVANYVTTLAVGLAVSSVIHGGAGWVEIVATLLISPVIFVFGELIPKNLYYRAPMMLLRRGCVGFQFFYRLFLPISFPLIGITKLIERIGRVEDQPIELVLGRNRLVQVLSQGHREGLLTDVQSKMVNGLMHTAAQPVRESVTPVSRVLNVFDDANRQSVLEHASKYGLSHIAVLKSGTDNDWLGYVRVADLRITGKSPKELIRPMPRVDAAASKLEALLTMRQADEAYGLVVAGEKVMGIVNERGLIEQLFRPPQAGIAPGAAT